jgi:hypothetical protein
LTLADRHASRPHYVYADEVGEVTTAHVEEQVASHLARVYGREVSVARVEEWTNEEGKKVYVVWTRE